MFNRKSIYALNKKDPNAIVYTDADGNLIRLTCDDFACAAEFQHWKDWSDSDLRKEENADHQQADNAISMEVLSEEATAVASIEDEYMEMISADEGAALVRLLRQGLSSHLTETQRRRLWKYCVEGKPVRLIANGMQCGLHNESTIMLEQLRTLDKQRLLGYAGTVGKSKMREVNTALEISIGIKNLLPDNKRKRGSNYGKSEHREEKHQADPDDH